MKCGPHCNVYGTGSVKNGKLATKYPLIYRYFYAEVTAKMLWILFMEHGLYRTDGCSAVL